MLTFEKGRKEKRAHLKRIKIAQPSVLDGDALRRINRIGRGISGFRNFLVCESLLVDQPREA
jgi:hypothetical protein